MREYVTQPIVDPTELAARIAQWVNRTQTMPSLPSPPPPLDCSPISILPPEIVTEIFLLIVPTECFPGPAPTTAPLSLTHVCRYWRRLAKAIPDLWCRLHLNYCSAIEDVPAVHTWLSHSGDKPLSLSLSIDFDERPHQAIINVLAQHSRRWKHIRFEFRNLQCPPIYDLATAIDNVPMLSTFEFHARDISTSNIAPISGLLATAPRLKGLTWVDDLADSDTLLSLPLPRLSRLSLSMNHGSLDYLKLLNMCSNLEHIRITRPFPEIRPPQPPLVLPKLTSLNIAHDLTGILDHLILPFLKRFRVHMDSTDPERLGGRYSRSLIGVPSISWDPTPLLRLVERSSCAIDTLQIYAPIKELDLAMCLKASSGSLQSLTISGGATLSNATIELLTPRRSLTTSLPAIPESKTDERWDCLCPFLTELVIGTTPTESSFVEMVERRLGLIHTGPELPSTSSTSSGNHSNPISPLKRLKVQYPAGHQDVGYLRELANLVNSRNPGSFELSVVESRLGNMRGSSAGRTRMFLYRRKVCASR